MFTWVQLSIPLSIQLYSFLYLFISTLSPWSLSVVYSIQGVRQTSRNGNHFRHHSHWWCWIVVVAFYSLFLNCFLCDIFILKCFLLFVFAWRREGKVWLEEWREETWQLVKMTGKVHPNHGRHNPEKRNLFYRNILATHKTAWHDRHFFFFFSRNHCYLSFFFSKTSFAQTLWLYTLDRFTAVSFKGCWESKRQEKRRKLNLIWFLERR